MARLGIYSISLTHQTNKWVRLIPTHRRASLLIAKHTVVTLRSRGVRHNRDHDPKEPISKGNAGYARRAQLHYVLLHHRRVRPDTSYSARNRLATCASPEAAAESQ